MREGEASLQIAADAVAVFRVAEKPDAVAIAGQGVLEPVQRLDDAHRRSARPIEAACGGRFEDDRELVEMNGMRLCVRVDRDARRARLGQAEVVGRRNAINEDAGLVTPRKRVDDGPVVR
jgi:hypothetical protein